MWHEYTGSVSESHVSSQTLGEVKKKKRKKGKKMKTNVEIIRTRSRYELMITCV